MANSKIGDTVRVYLVVSEVAVSSVLFVLSSEKPTYFPSKKLTSREHNYIKMEKFALALIYTAKKLQHYVQGKSINVLTEEPLKKVLKN